MQARLTNNDWSSKAILEAISLGKETISIADTFGWYAIASTTFTAVVRSADINFWQHNAQVRAAITNGNFNPDNYDIFYTIFDADRATNLLNNNLNGNAPLSRTNINIDGTDYGAKHLINIYGDNDKLFAKQCFFERQIRNDLARCYDNPRGDNYARVDSTLIHEYLHTNVLTGIL